MKVNESVCTQVVGLALCQKTTGGGGRSRQVQPLADLAQISDAAGKLSTLLDQVYIFGYISGSATFNPSRFSIETAKVDYSAPLL